MNRIKFKAWKKINDPEMFEDIRAIDFGENIIKIGYKVSEYTTRIDKESLDNVELLQSTGLFDKNGTEIFEGDIVKNEINEVGYIEWSKCRFNFCDSVGHFYLFSIGARQPFEILGNIYEHPHLLREDTQ